MLLWLLKFLLPGPSSSREGGIILLAEYSQFLGKRTWHLTGLTRILTGSAITTSIPDLVAHFHWGCYDSRESGVRREGRGWVKQPFSIIKPRER